LPDLRWLRTGAAAAVVSVLVLEHVEDFATLLAHVGRALEPGGRFVLVMNHPAYTPSGAGPVVDLSDGEVFWRWGPYFASGSGTEPAGAGAVVFHHRPLGLLLNTVAGSGLALERFEERALGTDAVARDPGLSGQEHFPRLLGALWRKIPTASSDSHPAGL
jgi:SAM-dependent methyltransferase